jgi:hypothetical protein
MHKFPCLPACSKLVAWSCMASTWMSVPTSRPTSSDTHQRMTCIIHEQLDINGIVVCQRTCVALVIDMKVVLSMTFTVWGCTSRWWKPWWKRTVSNGIVPFINLDSIFCSTGWPRRSLNDLFKSWILILKLEKTHLEHELLRRSSCRFESN